MATVRIFRINYKSDFILTLHSDAGWMTPFCIKFWTGAPSQAYYASFDGTDYTNCAAGEDPKDLTVQFDDHGLPIGDLKFQVAYHFTVEDFPNDTEDEVINQANITTEIDGQTYQVMLDFNGETAPEIDFSLPAYANEAQRIENEQTRIANEETRVANEEQRVENEQARVEEYAELKADAVVATGAANDAAALANQKAQLADDKAALANDAATLANQKAQLAADKAQLANDAATLANQKAQLAQQKAEYAQTQGGYAKEQGDYAKQEGDAASNVNAELSGNILTVTNRNGQSTSSNVKGLQGDPGAAATVAVGTVTTGEPGTDASVTNSGTSSAAILDFSIPQGAKGDPGNYTKPANGIPLSDLDPANIDDVPTADSGNLVKSGGVFSTVHNAVTLTTDKTSSAGSWMNANQTAYATLELDESGHNGTWHLIKKSIQSSAIRMYMPVTNGKIYNISFDVQYSGNVTIARLNGSASSGGGAYALVDYYSGNIVYIKNGHVEINVQKTSDWAYLYVTYGGIDTLTYPLDVTISNFALLEITGDVKSVIENTDSEPTNGSNNLVESGGVYTAINTAADNVAFSTNEKVNTIGIEASPVYGSKNLVDSNGIEGVTSLHTIIDYSGIDVIHRTITDAAKWQVNTNADVVLIPIETNTKYILRNSTLDSGTYYTLLTSNTTKTSGDVTTFATGYDGRISLPASSSATIITPSDGHYLYLVLKSSSGEKDVTVMQSTLVIDEIQEIESDMQALLEDVEEIKEGADDAGYGVRKRLAEIEGNSLTPVTIPVDESGYEIPQTREVINVQRKAKQMTDIVWTPLAAVPNNSDGFPANTPVTGLPYSSVKEKDKSIGSQVSIHTFMTAVNNPFSLLYTENVKGTTSASAWGITYHGINCATYFGTVCSSFTSYATGMTVGWPTACDKWCSRWRLNMVKIHDQSAQGLHIGDIYWKSGHNRLIVGLKRDSNGDVTHVVVAESIGTKVKENDPRTASSFNSLIASEEAIIYRNLELYKNNNYAPSPFVAVGDEVITPYVYNDDICTFAGDKACFRENDLIVLNYNLKNSNSDWTGIEVYKDGTLVDTYTIANIDQSALPEGQRNHALSLGSSHTYGAYKARLTDGTNYSDYTYWEVLQTTITHSLADGVSHITWTSANGKVVGYAVVVVNGSQQVSNEFSEEEVEAGEVYVNLRALRMQQKGSDFSDENLYLKIYFEGEYGRVTNEPLSIIL